MTCLVVTSWASMENAPGGAGYTLRGLTHSLDSTKEGLAMDATRNCVPETKTVSLGIYQVHARKIFEATSCRDLEPWSWIMTTCGDWCLNPQHMIVRTATKIAYPPGVCIYCGDPAWTKDHLLPRTMTGDARRQVVAVVPACGSCNSTIGAFPEHNITKRREFAHKRLRARKRKILYAMDWTESELQELGPHLRRAIEGFAAERNVTLARLAWPEDPLYDLAAFQRAGIDDPVALGLIDNPFTPGPSRGAGSKR